MQKDTPPFVWAAPDEKNILHCEFLPYIACSLGLMLRLSANRELYHRSLDSTHVMSSFSLIPSFRAAWPARQPLRRWRVLWSHHVPFRISFQAARHQDGYTIWPLSA